MTGNSNPTRSFISTLTLGVVALLFLQLMGGMLLSPQRTFFPVYLQELGYSALQISSLSTVRLVMAMLSSLVGGTLSDVLGRKWTLLLGNVGFLVGSLAFLTSDPGWIGVLWALSGFGSGLHTLGSQSYLIDVAASEYLGLLSALYNWGYTLGGALSSPFVGVLLDRRGYGPFGWTLAVCSLVTIAINGFLLPRARSTGDRGSIRPKALFGYATLARRPAVILLVLLRFLPTVCYGMTVVLIPLLLHAGGADKITIAAYATVSQVAASLAQIAVGRIADRRGAKGVTVVTFIALVASTLGTGVLHKQLWGVFVMGSLAIAAAWSLSTLLPSLVARVTEAEERGRVLGWIHLWWNVAMIVGAMIGGALFELQAGLPFLITGALNVISVGLVLRFFDRNRNTVCST